MPGGEVAYTDDINQNSIDAGQGRAGLPGSILRMTGDPLQVINPANLPVDPKTCKPIEFTPEINSWSCCPACETAG